MSHNDSSPTPNAPPPTDSTPHDFVVLSLTLQSIAKVLLDHSNTAETKTYRESTILHRIAQLLLNKHHPYDLYECIDTIYAELAIALELLNSLNEYTYKPVLDVYVQQKNLAKSLRKLEELHTQLEPSYVFEKVTSPRQ